MLLEVIFLVPRNAGLRKTWDLTTKQFLLWTQLKNQPVGISNLIVHWDINIMAQHEHL